MSTIHSDGFADISNIERAAIAIAPSDMTVTAAVINTAALSAISLASKVDALVVIAYEFEASTRSKTVEHRGKIKIIKAQANRDLQIGNLKDKKSDDAFVMIGEPDISIICTSDNSLVVEVLGFDTYNPSTGNIVPGGAKDIDCWMMDTNYNGESFFACRLHFPEKSNDRQLERLRRKLQPLLNREAWDAMLSYKSLPFDRPSTGQIAVRIVTNTHTEMTTVIDCENIK